MKAFCHIYAQWDQVGKRIEEEARHLLGLDLICDTTFDLREGEDRVEILRTIYEAGGLCAHNHYPGYLDPNLRDANWWKCSENQCRELLAKVGEGYARIGLPKGIERRWKHDALCSVEIPEACLHWPAVGVCKLYDWVAERGAPGLLSHLWVTRVP